MKRWLIASGIFLAGVIILLSLVAYRSWEASKQAVGTGIGFVHVTALVSPAAAILTVIWLGVFAIWLSAKLN